MKNGLEDVIAAETQLSDVDGEAGRLIIRGVSLDHLVANGTYEGVAALLLDGLMEKASTKRNCATGWRRREQGFSVISRPPMPPCSLCLLLMRCGR